MFQNPISLWHRSTISHPYDSTSDADSKAVRVKAHEVCKISISLLFKKNYAVQQVLKAGTKSSQSTLSFFYSKDLKHSYMDAFYISPVVTTNQVM